MESDTRGGSDVEQLCNDSDRISYPTSPEIVDDSFDGSESYSSDEGRLGDTKFYECQFCRDIYITKEASDISQQEDLHSLFHAPCSGCSAQDPSLCAHCQHSRLRHHLLCDEDRNYKIWISLKHLVENLRNGSSPSCAMCSFFVEAAQQENKTRVPNRNMEKCTDVELECRNKLCCDPELITAAIRGSPWVLRLWVFFDYEIDGISNFSVTLAGFDIQSQTLACIDPSSAGSVRVQDDILQKRAIPQVGQTVNWKFIKNQLETCCANHQNCHLAEVQLPRDFRLIDVANRCLVQPAHSDVSYFALSYVWGKACDVSNPEQTVAALTKSSLNDLLQKGSLSSSVLPKTIEDTLQACLELGSKYLWVDRLCIVQDDDENKSHQIHAMGNIFASAKLVLIAVDAEDMHSGISGISRLRRNTSQATIKSSGTSLQSVLTNLERSTTGTPWFSRAWTYQEAILARQKVWFTPVQAHFECQSGIFTEDLWGSRLASTETRTSQVHPPGCSTTEAFAQHLQEYSRRSLTYQSDIYNALTGIANSLYGGQSLIYGLPQKDFDQFLVWENNPSIPRSADGVVLPSWSWAFIHAPVLLDTRSFCGSLVKWFACVGQGIQASTVPIQADNEPDSWTKRKTYQNFPNRGWGYGGCSPHLYMVIACIQGCIQTTLPEGLCNFSIQTLMELEMSAQTLWPTYGAYCQHLYGWDPESKELTQAKMQMLEPGTLIACAQTAILRYTRHVEHKQCRLGTQVFDFELNDDYGRPVGLWTGVEPHSVIQGGRIKAIALSVFNSGPYHFYHPTLWCLSTSFPSLCGFKSCCNKEFLEAGMKVLQDPKESLTFFDCEEKALLPPPMLKVMIVQEDGQFHRRIGLGEVFLARWVQAGPHFETVLLR